MAKSGWWAPWKQVGSWKQVPWKQVGKLWSCLTLSAMAWGRVSRLELGEPSSGVWMFRDSEKSMDEGSTLTDWSSRWPGVQVRGKHCVQGQSALNSHSGINSLTHFPIQHTVWLRGEVQCCVCVLQFTLQAPVTKLLMGVN